MERIDLDIEGPCLLKNRVFSDERGFFTERWREDAFAKVGIHERWIQDNFSRSEFRVLRGLHFQWDPPQGKLVTCTRGRIFDVAVDIRFGSPTFGRHVSVELSCENPQWFFIPAGFAHGFQVVSSEGADVMYKVNHLWNSKGEGAIRWNDPSLNIQWPFQDPLLSEKDRVADSFQNYISRKLEISR